MTIVKEVVELIQLLADLVRDTRDLAKAVNNGQAYLSREHPEAKADLAEMLSQIEKTVQGLTTVTSVVTKFRFTTKGKAVDSEPARFNEYVMKQEGKLNGLRSNIRKLKGNCEKVRNARDRLNELAGDEQDRTAMFRLFGKKRRQMDIRLANSLGQFYANDQRIIEVINKMLSLSETALDEADKALGPKKTATPDRVGKAAAVLNDYAAAFEDSKKELDELVGTLDDTVKSLR